MTWMSYLSNMHGKGIFEGQLFSPGLKRAVSHGCAPFQAKQFVLWRGKRRLVLGEEDLHTNRIASVCKVSAAKLVIPFAAFRPPSIGSRFNRLNQSSYIKFMS